MKSTKLDEAKVDGINDNEKIQELRNQLALLEEKNEAANRYQQQKQVVIIEDNTLHNKPQNKENSQSNQNKRDVTEIQQPVDKEAIGEYKEQLDNDVQYFSQWNSRKGGAIIGGWLLFVILKISRPPINYRIYLDPKSNSKVDPSIGY